MRIQDLPTPTRFMFWCVAPFLVLTLVFLPLLVSPPQPIGWVAVALVEVLSVCILFGFYDPIRFKVFLRVAGAIVFVIYVAYLIEMITAGKFVGRGGRAESTAINAFLGLIVFGYPGFMYAAFGRFSWRQNPNGDSQMETDDGWQKLWDSRLAALESELGKSDDQIATSPIPIYLGGFADVLTFKNHIDGFVYVTAGLIGEGGQQKNDLGEFELMMCAKEECDWMPSLISRLARYTFDSELHAGDTMDIAPAVPPGSTIAALLFVPYRKFKVDEIDAGVLLCIGITEEELEYRGTNGHVELLERLKSKGVYPYTVADRDSVVS